MRAGFLEYSLILFCVTFTYVTFFVILIPLEVYVVYLNACHLSKGEYFLPTITLGGIIIYILYVMYTKKAPFNGNGAPS